MTIYADNCCQVRRKLQQIFGTGTSVKLDIFHAVQRITRAMSKKHVFFHTCMNDFRMVFRHTNDIGRVRNNNTPECKFIQTNLNNFVRKWKDVEHNGYKILTEKVTKQISALRIHIEQGCLSNIEPGGGTNYNETLHRRINPHFNHAGRMGLPLAYALLTILLYRHNCKKESSLSQIISAKLTTKMNKPTTPLGITGRYYKNCGLSDCALGDRGELRTDDELISDTNVEHIMQKAVFSASLAESMSS